jgi:hypothetical protein
MLAFHCNTVKHGIFLKARFPMQRWRRRGRRLHTREREKTEYERERDKKKRKLHAEIELALQESGVEVDDRVKAGFRGKNH